MVKQHVFFYPPKYTTPHISRAIDWVLHILIRYHHCEIFLHTKTIIWDNFYILRSAQQAHTIIFSEHQNLAKTALFHFTGHMLCHMGATKKIFEIFLDWYHICFQINFGGPKHITGRYRPAGSSKIPKKRPQKKISYSFFFISINLDDYYTYKKW